MKVLFVGDAIAPTGFANSGRAVCDGLHHRGHEVHVLAINYYGDACDTLDVPYRDRIYTTFNPPHYGRDAFGETRLPHVIRKIRPQVVIIQQDPWNIPGYFEVLDDAVRKDQLKANEIPLMMGFLAVDGQNQHGEPLNRLDHIVTWTEFGMNELRLGGYEGSGSIVPLGVNLDIYKPLDKRQSRSLVCPFDLPSDGFLVGYVGRNQPRKRVDLLLRCFARWVHNQQIDNAFLYLHVAPTGESGYNLASLIDYYKLRGRVFSTDFGLGLGHTVEQMAHVYNSMDVFATCTQGEGWGLPCLEAMACGIPVVCPEWSGLGEWAGDAAMMVPCVSTSISAPLGIASYTIGGVPSEKATVLALDTLYKSEERRRHHRDRGFALAAKYPWSRTSTEFADVFDEFVDSHFVAEEQRDEPKHVEELAAVG